MESINLLCDLQSSSFHRNQASSPKSLCICTLKPITLHQSRKRYNNFPLPVLVPSGPVSNGPSTQYQLQLTTKTGGKGFEFSTITELL
uniref:Uncharacterized protein n=1 Tax=Moniliophthora roreri TaxID=221103 RepID=A0A0W0FDR0_MONRR